MSRIYFLLSGTVFFIILLYPTTPPGPFPRDSIITVPEGVGLFEVAEKLHEDNVIRSPFWFRMAAIMLGGERDMKAGEYYMLKPQNTFTIAWRVVHGSYDIETVKLTIPEGFTTNKIVTLFDNRFKFFDHSNFLTMAPEGYLFPDTYFIPVTANASSTIKLMRDNFERKIIPLKSQVESSDRTLEEIITMASIVESEAQLKEDREIISGILWKRMDLGLPLQVDSSFVYINGKTTKELTKDDLKIDSPYNTYLYKGLPPTPIANPGLESIEAVLHPTKTAYLFFLTGDDGKMYYAKTFKEHVLNKQKHLSN